MVQVSPMKDRESLNEWKEVGVTEMDEVWYEHSLGVLTIRKKTPESLGRNETSDNNGKGRISKKSPRKNETLFLCFEESYRMFKEVLNGIEWKVQSKKMKNDMDFVCQYTCVEGVGRCLTQQDINKLKEFRSQKSGDPEHQVSCLQLTYGRHPICDTVDTSYVVIIYFRLVVSRTVGLQMED